jgi:putative endonuclease
MQEKTYCVYILTNKNATTFYIGVTNDLPKRLFEHRNKLVHGFTSNYNLSRLVYYEATSDVMSAIEREKQLKHWSRDKKERLIERVNPHWNDLSDDFLDD